MLLLLNEHGDPSFLFQILSSYDKNNQLAKFEKNLSVGSISVEWPRRLFFQIPAQIPQSQPVLLKLKFHSHFSIVFFFHESQSHCTKSHFPASEKGKSQLPFTRSRSFFGYPRRYSPRDYVSLGLYDYFEIDVPFPGFFDSFFSIMSFKWSFLASESPIKLSFVWWLTSPFLIGGFVSGTEDDIVDETVLY